MSRRRLLLVLFCVATAGFALRLAVAAKFEGLDAPPDAASNPDQLDYELIGWRVADGHGYTLADHSPTARRPPGTSFTLLLPYSLFGRSFTAARVWFCVISAATCFVTGLLAAELFGAATGVIAAALLAFLPGHFYYAMHFLSEVPYGLVIALAALGAVTSLKREPGRSTLALDLFTGASFGFALLTRPQAAFAGPLAFVAALCAPKALRSRCVRQVLTIGVACALVVVPWIVRNAVVMGKPTISTIGGVTFWGANNAVIAADPGNIGGWMPINTLIDAGHPFDGSEVENDATAWRYGMEYLSSHPEQAPQLFAMKLVRHLSPFRETSNRAVYWSFALSWLALAPFLVAGCVIGWRRRRAGTLVLLLPIASTLITALVFYGSVRFRDGEAALYVIPAAAALAVLAPRVTSRRCPPPPKPPPASATTSSSGSTSR